MGGVINTWPFETTIESMQKNLTEDKRIGGGTAAAAVHDLWSYGMCVGWRIIAIN